MFCYKCGKQIPDDAAFCQHCGAPCATNTSSQQPSRQEMAQKLKQFKNVKKCTCLECGYEGLMGVVRIQEYTKKQKRNIWISRIVAVLVFLAILPVGFLWGFILGAILGAICSAIENSYKRNILFCPCCDKELLEQK